MSITIGGDAEQYMDAPTLKVGGGGGGGDGPSFIASILDLLGINHQVAKPPKDAKKEIENAVNATPQTQMLPAINPAGQKLSLSTPSLPILDSVGQAFAAPKVSTAPIGISDVQWMGGYRSTAPATMQVFDPNLAFQK